MKRKLITVVALLLTFGQHAFSQAKEFETEEQAWLGYFNQTRFTNKSGVWVDLHLRFTGNYVNHVG